MQPCLKYYSEPIVLALHFDAYLITLIGIGKGDLPKENIAYFVKLDCEGVVCCP